MTPTMAQQSSTRGLEAEFLDLICADEELLRAEFDAIIAAGWPTSPPTVRGTGRRRVQPPAGGRGALAVHARLRIQRRDAPDARPRSRQRAPPRAVGRSVPHRESHVGVPTREVPGCVGDARRVTAAAGGVAILETERLKGGDVAVEPMGAADTAWLHMDRPTNLMVVNIVVSTEQPIDDAALTGVLEQRLLAQFRRFRQRVDDPALTVGLLSSPVWVDDDSFELSYHFHVTALPEPADRAALQRIIGELASRPLNRSRPLWELHLFTGYGAGSALLLRTHHAIADGAALMQVLLALTDPADSAEHTGVLGWNDDLDSPVFPGAAGRAAHSMSRAAGRATGTATTLGTQALGVLTNPRAALEFARRGRAEAAMLLKLGVGLRPPRNRLQGSLGSDKRFAWTEPVPLADVKRAGRRRSGTVNDVMLAAITGALRRYFAEHGDVVDETVVIVPVNLRSADAPVPSGLGNEFGLLFVPLPTGEADADRRQSAIKEQMDQIKASREGAFLYSMLELMGQVPTGAQNTWIDLFADKATAIVTNVAGPQHPVTLAGCRVIEVMAWVPVTGPVGLGLSVFSYNGHLAVGVVSDAQLLPDADRLLALLDDELGRLHTSGAPT
jgi:WS/DGAT/MGAT family acyltransferase